MKRIFVLSLALILAVSSMAVPSYAAEFDTGEWIELLDFNQVSNQGNWTQIDSYYVLTMIPPAEAQYFNVDMVVFSNGTFTNVYETRAGDRKPLNIVSLGDGLYRIYGDLHIGSNYPAIYFEFLTTGLTSMTLLSCRVSQVPVSYFDSTAAGFLYAAGEWEDVIYSPGSPGNSVSIDTKNTSTWNFTSGIRLDNWKGFDYIDIHCSFTGVASITSVSGFLVDSHGDVLGNMVPLDISYISNSFYSDGGYELVIRVNLRNLDRTQNYFPMIDIQGEHGGQFIGFGIYGVIGYVFSDVVDQDIFWLKKFWNSVTSGFSSLISSIGSGFQSVVNYFNTTFWNSLVSQYNSIRDTITSGFNTLASILSPQADTDGFQNQVDDQGDRLDQMDEALNSVTKPAFDRVDTNISGIVSDADLANSAHVYTYIIDDSIMAPALTMVTILAMMSFALFGKR